MDESISVIFGGHPPLDDSPPALSPPPVPGNGPSSLLPARCDSKSSYVEPGGWMSQEVHF